MITFSPDVSRYDATQVTGKLAPMDWAKCRDVDKISIAIIKSSEYEIDPAFKLQWSAAKGILPRMAYHYFRPQRSNQWEVLRDAIGNDFQDNDLIALDWEYSYWLMTTSAQRNAAYDLLEKMRIWFATTPYVYTYPNFWNSIIGGKNDVRFAKYKLWQAEWPYDISSAPIWGSAYMENFKTRIRAGVMKPSYILSPWNRPLPDIWQFTSRCAPSYIKGYTPLAAKKAVDMNAVYVDVSH